MTPAKAKTGTGRTTNDHQVFNGPQHRRHQSTDNSVRGESDQMSKITKLIKAHILAYKGVFSLLDELTHPKFRGYDPRVNSWVNHEESKILISTVGKEILVGKSRVIFENEEFLCFEVFRKYLNIDFIATMVAVKYKDNKVIEIESLNEELNQDPSEGQDWNWEDYE